MSESGIPNVDCSHKRVTHVHGTRACYVHDHCPCGPCRQANTAYANSRARQIAEATFHPDRASFVDAGPVRDHVRSLMAAGMGRRTVATAAHVPQSTLYRLLYGTTGPDGQLVPSRRIGRRTADALLAVRLTLAAGVRVDQTGTARRLQALFARGWSGTKLATRLGMLRSNFTPLLHGTRPVTVATRTNVAALFDELWNADPPLETRADRVAASRARRTASRLGWVPALAWDDDTIDDPTAQPQRGSTTARVTLVDQVVDLASLGCCLPEISQRLQRSERAIRNLLHRSHPDVLARITREDSDRPVHRIPRGAAA